MSVPEGGEAVCYLSLADDAGSILSPDEQVLIGPSQDAKRLVIAAADPTTGVLFPLVNESVEDYRARLERPAERTAAWRLALAAQQAPIALSLDAVNSEAYVPALAAYIRGLLEED